MQFVYGQRQDYAIITTIFDGEPYVMGERNKKKALDLPNGGYKTNKQEYFMNTIRMKKSLSSFVAQ